MVPITAWLSEARQYSRESGRPLVTLSYAQSLDGCISARRGMPTTISGPESMKLTHQLRAAHDAILVGIGTVLADDPRLTVRLIEGEDPQPVILDSSLRLPSDARLLQGSRPPWIATAQHNLQRSSDEALQERRTALLSRGAQLLPVPVDERGRLSLSALLTALADKGICSLMVEGGARVITSFLRQNLVDQLVLTVSPIILAGLPAVERDTQPGVHKNSSGDNGLVPHLHEIGYDRYGQDLIIWGRLR